MKRLIGDASSFRGTSSLPRLRELQVSTTRSCERTSMPMSIPARGTGRTGKRGLIDTSIAIALAKIDRESLPDVIAVSALTMAELVSGLQGAEHELRRVQRVHHLRCVEAKIMPLGFDLHCARAYGPIYAAIVRTGRKPRGGRAVDLMIAATALAHRLPLYTLNPKDLRGLEDLIEIIDVGSKVGR